jgi:hypothetical protein
VTIAVIGGMVGWLTPMSVPTIVAATSTSSSCRGPVSRLPIEATARSTSMTTGLKWAPDAAARMRMSPITVEVGAAFSQLTADLV